MLASMLTNMTYCGQFVSVHSPFQSDTSVAKKTDYCILSKIKYSLAYFETHHLSFSNKGRIADERNSCHDREALWDETLRKHSIVLHNKVADLFTPVCQTLFFHSLAKG